MYCTMAPLPAPSESEPVRFIHSPIDWVPTRAADNSRGILLMAGGTLLTTATLVFMRLLGRDLQQRRIPPAHLH